MCSFLQGLLAKSFRLCVERKQFGWNLRQMHVEGKDLVE